MQDKSMTDILRSLDSLKKKTLNENLIAECPPDMVSQPSNVNISISGNSMADIMRALDGIERSSTTKGDILASPMDNPKIPGRDDVAGDQDLNQGVLGALTGAGLGGAAGLALGGPMGGLTGALAGAAAGDQLTDVDYDDPSNPGRDDVEGDVDLHADVGGLIGAAGDAIRNLGTQALQKGAEIGGNLGSRAAGAATDALGPDTLRRLAGMGDMVGGRAADASGLTRSIAQRRGAEIGQNIGKGAVAIGAPAAALGGAAALGTNKGDKEVEEWSNEPDETYQDHEYMTKTLSGGINREKRAYAAAQPGDNAMAVEDAGRLSQNFIKALDLKFGNKPKLSTNTMIKLRAEMVKFGPNEVMQLAKANIPHVSDAAQHELDNRRARGLKGYDENIAVESIKGRLYKALSEKKAKPDFLDMDKDGNKKEPMKKAIADKKKKGPVKEAEVQAPNHELSDLSRKASAMAQIIKRKINSGEQMDDRDYNQIAELGSVLSRVGATFGPKSMKDVFAHMKQYTDDRNQEGHNYPEFSVDRFKELIAMASSTGESAISEISSDLAKRYTKNAKVDRDNTDHILRRDGSANDWKANQKLQKRNSLRTKGINRAAKRIER
jgi:hypothetical protein